MGDSQDLVLILLQRRFDLVELWSFANGRLELCGLDAICLETVGKRVGKVASV